MDRRTVLRSLGLSAAALAGAAVVENAWSGGGTARANERVVYRDPDMQLLLTAREDSARLSDTIDFEVFNGGTEEVVLGCNTPWQLQRDLEDGWRDVTVSTREWQPGCLYFLPPGEALVEQVTLTESGLRAEAHVDDLQIPIHPGAYRFVLMGTRPHLAVDFEVLPGNQPVEH